MRRQAKIVSVPVSSDGVHSASLTVGDDATPLVLDVSEIEAARLRKALERDASLSMSIGGGATMRRHASKQDVQTPPELIAAVVRRFGQLRIDLAATAENKQADAYFGVGSAIGEDALHPDLAWREHVDPGDLAWLNPPFANIAPWAAKCAAESREGMRIAMLVPASVGARWYREHVHPYAMVYALHPRVTFVGHTKPFPKDLLLAVYDADRTPDFDPWGWR